MTNLSSIGRKAKELDEMHISERVRIERSSLKKVLVALFFYGFMMLFFSVFI
jgi:hypothetical protein